MDAIGLDLMLPEYQERREEAADYIAQNRERPGSFQVEDWMADYEAQNQSERPGSPAPDIPDEEKRETETSPESSTDDHRYEEEVGKASTVPATEVDLSEAEDSPGKATNLGAKNSSIDSFHDISSRGHASIYNPSFISPGVNYDRDNPEQRLVAVFGREFDMPDKVACSLQNLVETGVDPLAAQPPPIKFVPFTLKRKTLLKGTFDSNELVKHDLICMCYNASEARIMLTGTDGYYSSLLRHIEAVLGPNKVAFLITNYRQDNRDSSRLVCQPLKTRLGNQDALKTYLEDDQVLSWTDSPAAMHLEQLAKLAELQRNPQSYLLNQSCVCL